MNRNPKPVLSSTKSCRPTISLFTDKNVLLKKKSYFSETYSGYSLKYSNLIDEFAGGIFSFLRQL